jgi:hypothetical protein
MTALTSAQKQALLRERRAALGIKQLVLMAHVDDHAALKGMAKKLAKKRAKAR